MVGSVYLAIALEGAADDRARRSQAVEALGSLRSELDQDRLDPEDIVEAQRDRLVRHERIERWLSNPGAIPADSIAADFYTLFSVNRTMFPRTSAWTTMVASGQLADLGDEDLVSRLASFYENRSSRLVYNGELYDEWVSEIALSTVPNAWDRVNHRLAISSSADLARFRGQLLALNDLGANFVVLLEDWGLQLDTVLREVDRFLGGAGGGA